MNKNENMKVFYHGHIPKDWDVMSLGEMTTLLTNGFVGKAKDHYVETDDGVLYLQGYNISDSGFNFYGIKKVSKAFHLKNAKSCLQEGDLLTIQTGEIGLTSVVPKELAGANCHALVISRLKKEIAYPNFFFQYFNSEIGKRKFKTIETGSTMKHLNVGDMDSLEFPLPSLPEQKAIAQVLSTADAAIHTTEKLIAQKELRKKWLMQQLLTGKKRLKGFEGEWEDIELGELLDYEQPTKYLVSDTLYDDSYSTPVLTAGKTFILGYTNEEHGICNDVPVVIFDDFTTASKYVDFHFKAKSSAMKLLRPKPNVNLKYVFEAMQLINYTVGGHERHWISKFVYLTVPCPPIEEQNAIAQVLQAADKEISLLKAKAEKLREQKKGLMQVLLTGKVRLKITV